MMPLCTTATLSVACGCALTSFGWPCVAQRVWPMPMVPASGSLVEALFQILQLALGAPARQVAAFQRRDAGGIVAAIFEALERLDHFLGDRLAPEYPDDPAHAWNIVP